MEGRFHLVGVREAARYLGLSYRTIYNQLSEGTFPIKPRRIGGAVRFDMGDLDKFIENSASPKKKEG